MQHRGTIRIETECLILRPYRESDGDAMFRNWASDPEVSRYLTWQAHENAQISRRFCAMQEQRSARPECYDWIIELKTLVEPIGSIGVVQLREDIDAAELGYCLGRAWWGQGLMCEALQAVIRYLICDVGFRRITAAHDIENVRSGRVMQKCGMRREAICRAAGRNNRGVVDMVCYAILSEDLDRATPGAFYPMGRIRQALSREDCLEVLQKEKRGVLSLAGIDGYPYGLPIDHWYDPQSGKLYFHCGAKGHKLDAIALDPRASYCVYEQGEQDSDGWSYWFRSVVVFGHIEMVQDHEEALEICRLLSRRFISDEAHIEDEVRRSGWRVAVFALVPEHISGKRVHES